ncbi:MAG: glycosyltransferase family 2 protein [Planctomycetota bacterium]
MANIPISIMILTLNEEDNIEACLDSVSDFDEAVVFDSFSSDQTTQRAEAKGARVVQRKFDNWSAHQNWAMENIDFKNPWVFYLDADERMTPELQAEVKAIAEGETEHRAYYCGRKNYFMGKWIRHAMPPGTIMRFFQPPHIRFERLVNPTPVVDGSIGYLTHMFEHYNFSKGLAEWFAKHNNYSSMEAVEGMKVVNEVGRPWGKVFTRDRAERRQALKQISFSLPMRANLKFLYFYFVQRGFLDGRAGYLYCKLQATYELMIDMKMKELKRKEKGLAV